MKKETLVTWDITPFLVEAIATNKKIISMIDEQYNRHKVEAYHAAKDCPHYTHYLITNRDIEWEIRCKKILGLLLIDDSPINEIIKSKNGWSYLWHLIENNDSEIFINEVITKLISNFGQLSSDQINAIFILLLYIQQFLKKNIAEDKYYNKLVQDFNIRHEYHRHLKLHSINEIDTPTKNKCQKIYKAITKKYKHINYFFHVVDIAEKHYPNLFTELSLIFDSEKITFFFDDEKVYRNDIIEILSIYVYQDKTDIDFLTEKLIEGLLMKFLLKEFKKVKMSFFDHNKETLFVNLEQKDIQIKELTNDVNLLTREKEKLSSKNERLEKQFNVGEKAKLEAVSIAKQELTTEINHLKEENRHLKAKELQYKRLEKFLFSLPNENVDYSGISIEDYKILLVGGHINLQNKLMELYPSIDCMDGSNANIEPYLIGYYIVLFFAKHMGHPVYYKVVGECDRWSIPYGYVSHTNIELLVNQIKENIFTNLK